MKYGNVTMGQVEAAINILGGEEGWNDLLARRLEITKKMVRWSEKDGVITFTLPATDGTTGEQWIKRTEKKGNRVSDWAKSILRSPDFKPTTGVVYTVKVLKGELFSDSNRITKIIRTEAKKLGLTNLNAEAACLIRENFTDEELEAMGLWYVVVMHEPIKADGDLELLNVYRDCDGRWLDSCCGGPGSRWNRDGGFAFAVAQTLGTGA